MWFCNKRCYISKTKEQINAKQCTIHNTTQCTPLQTNIEIKTHATISNYNMQIHMHNSTFTYKPKHTHKYIQLHSGIEQYSYKTCNNTAKLITHQHTQTTRSHTHRDMKNTCAMLHTLRQSHASTLTDTEAHTDTDTHSHTDTHRHTQTHTQIHT